MATLAFIVTRSPRSEPHVETCLRLAAAALDQGHEVRVHLAMDAVQAAGRFEPLRPRGLQVLPDLPRLLEGADRVVTL